MGFTKRQQGTYRPMVAKAWAKHAAAEGLEPSNRAAREAWYRAELLACLGRETTADASAGRDFETVMAHFEVITGEDFYWNLRVFQGDVRRLQYSIEQICDHWELDIFYARAVAAKILKWPGRLEAFSEITKADDLQKVRIALLKHARRHGVREDRATAEAALQAHPELVATTGERTDPDGLPQGPYFDERAATESTFESPSKAHKRKAAEEQSRRLKRQDRLARTYRETIITPKA